MNKCFSIKGFLVKRFHPPYRKTMPLMPFSLKEMVKNIKGIVNSGRLKAAGFHHIDKEQSSLNMDFIRCCCESDISFYQVPLDYIPPFRLIEKVVPKDQGCREAAKNALPSRKKNKFDLQFSTRQW
jgi:hypothetical protein